MNKFGLFICIVIISSILVSPVYSQDQTQVGIGFGYSSGGSVNFLGGTLEFDDILSPANIYVPITFKKFRIEPEIGFIRQSSSTLVQDVSITTIHFGTGLFRLKNIYEDTNLYYGIRMGLIRKYSNATIGSNDYSDTVTNYFAGPALGAEYLLGEHFSIGGETQLLYISVDIGENSDASLTQTRATFFLRAYF